MRIMKKRSGKRRMKINRTLAEMLAGIFFLGIVCQIIGAFVVSDQLLYAKSLWFGILLAGAGAVHMYRSLDRALDLGKDASKIIFRAYLIRYVLIFAILLIIMTTGVLQPLVVFMAYMSLKAAAFLQPVTHKLWCKLESLKKGR